MSELDMLLHEFPLDGFVVIDLIVPIHSDGRLIRRDFKHAELIDLLELLAFRQCRTGHTADLVVLLEEILVGDGRQCLGFPLDPDSFLRFDRLMQPFGESPSRHRTTGMLVDDEHFVILDDIFLVFLVDSLCTERVLDMMDLFISEVLIEILYIEDLFQFCDSSSAECSGLGLLVDVIIAILFLVHSGFLVGEQLLEQSFGDLLLLGARRQSSRYLSIIDVFLGSFRIRFGDDQRRPRLIDQDTIHLIHDGIVQRPPDERSVLHGFDEIVPQIIESEL